jgi:hypothetical protein
MLCFLLQEYAALSKDLNHIREQLQEKEEEICEFDLFEENRPQHLPPFPKF